MQAKPAITIDPNDQPFPPAEDVYEDIDSGHEENVDRVPPPLPPPPSPRPRPRLHLPPPPSPRPRPRLPPPPPSKPLNVRRLPHQTSAPGLQNPAPVYEERKVPPPPPPKTYMYASLPNLAAGSSLFRPQAYTPKDLLANELPRPDITTGGPRRPAPPRPPPPVKMPSLNSSPNSSYVSSSLCPSSCSYSSLYSSSGYGEEPVYEEVEEPVYLQLLADGNRHYTYLDDLLEDWKNVDVCDNMSLGLYGVGRGDQTRAVIQKAMAVTRALKHFKSLLDSLQQRVSELTTFCDRLDKKQKKNKAMGIAGSTTGAVGGVAAVVGVALAPATMGISLVITAIGAGMVATASGIGARAAIADKKKAAGRTRFEGVVHDYTNDVVDMERCSLLIRDWMDKLRRDDCKVLWGPDVWPEALRIAELSQFMLENDMLSASGMSTASKGRISSVNLLQAFSGELDLYFTEKNGQKLKKSNEMKFASRVRQLAENLQEVLDELYRMWEKISG
ncbi:uncharacterized protein LOC132472596 isoform X2 [Gadus macrocephalus]|uniref:uncharacterized protein LOC132472596 isoform X2 n=1 Tax=Gadus macrocephalus TaxID=80720 RepID=UPI0028CB317D|nr:uncharacterized protein LOC132472596 isoform X2 [Gadus macrocephalus]